MRRARRVRIHTPTAADTEALGAPPRAQPPGRRLRVRGGVPAGRARQRQDHAGARFPARARRRRPGPQPDLHAASSSTRQTASPWCTLDLYRLRDPAELESLGLREWAAPGHLWLVEWPEKGGGRLPPADLALALERRHVPGTTSSSRPPAASGRRGSRGCRGPRAQRRVEMQPAAGRRLRRS